MNDSSAPEYSTPLLEFLFTHEHRTLQPIGSQVIGLLGLTVFAITSVVLASSGLWFLGSPSFVVSDPGIRRLVAAAIATPCVTMLYVVIGLTMHWFASCQIPLSIRLAFIYGLVFLSIVIITRASYEDSTSGLNVLFFAPFCAGGCIQQQRGWRALSWGQTIRPPSKPSVAQMMDATAAIALTLAILPLGDFDVRMLACWIPTGCMFAAAGMHLWGRLAQLSTNENERINGYAMWMMGNVCIAAGVILILIGMNRSSIELCFAILPLSYLTAVVCFALATAWLKACGWRFERYEESAAEDVST